MNEEEWIKLIGGGFAFMSAPFAVHPMDAERAREYRQQAKMHGLEWGDIQRHLSAYMDQKSFTVEAKAKELERARKFFKSFS